MKQPVLFSKKVLEILGKNADEKLSAHELDKFVPELLELANVHIFGGKLVNRNVKWADWRKGPKANVAGLTNWITEKKNNGEVDWTIQEIVLNSRLVNTKARLVEILFHELCHQGETELKMELKTETYVKPDNVIFDDMHRQIFYLMAAKFNSALTWMPNITGSHDYSTTGKSQNYRRAMLDSHERCRKLGLELAKLKLENATSNNAVRTVSVAETPLDRFTSAEKESHRICRVRPELKSGTIRYFCEICGSRHENCQRRKNRCLDRVKNKHSQNKQFRKINNSKTSWSH